MKAVSEASSTALATESVVRVRLEQVFFPFVALLMVGTVFLGFARTFFLAPLYDFHLPNLLVAIHGTVFASWIVLFAVQASLIPLGRVDLHKKLGTFGMVLMVLVFLMGYLVMLEGIHRGFARPGVDEASVLALDTIGINISFAMFVAGLLLRQEPAFHKRLMLFGTVQMLGPAVARWPFAIIQQNPPLVGAVLQSFFVMTIAFDLLTRHRVHRTTWLGGASLFLTPLLAIPLSGTTFWHHLLASLKQSLSRF